MKRIVSAVTLLAAGIFLIIRFELYGPVFILLAIGVVCLIILMAIRPPLFGRRTGPGIRVDLHWKSTLSEHEYPGPFRKLD